MLGLGKRTRGGGMEELLEWKVGRWNGRIDEMKKSEEWKIGVPRWLEVRDWVTVGVRLNENDLGWCLAGAADEAMQSTMPDFARTGKILACGRVCTMTSWSRVDRATLVTDGACLSMSQDSLRSVDALHHCIWNCLPCSCPAGSCSDFQLSGDILGSSWKFFLFPAPWKPCAMCVLRIPS